MGLFGQPKHKLDYKNYIISQQPFAYYPLDDATPGGTVSDAMKVGPAGAVGSAITVGTGWENRNVPTTPTHAVDNANAIISIPNTASIWTDVAGDQLKHPYSIEMLYKPGTLTTTSVYFCGLIGPRAFNIRPTYNGTVYTMDAASRIIYGAGSKGFSTIPSITTTTWNAFSEGRGWLHLVFVITDAARTLYVNGVAKPAETTACTSSYIGDWQNDTWAGPIALLGYYPYGTTPRSSACSLSDFSFWHRGLAATEIADHARMCGFYGRAT